MSVASGVSSRLLTPEQSASTLWLRSCRAHAMTPWSCRAHAVAPTAVRRHEGRLGRLVGGYGRDGPDPCLTRPRNGCRLAASHYELPPYDVLSTTALLNVA